MAAKLAKKDYDKDGKVESSSDEYMGAKDNAIKKARGMKNKSTKVKSNKAKKKVMKESASISTADFVSAVLSKNYAVAHKYLQGIIESKIEQRITTALEQSLF